MPDGTLPRRTVLTVVAATGTLAACSTAVPTAPPGSAGSAPTAGSGSDDSRPDDDGGGSGSGGSGGGGSTLGPASDVPVGSAKIYADRKVVVTQAAAGTFAAFSTTCPHQGCAVSSVSGGSIVCPCHGSMFALDGSVEQGPASRGLTARKVTVSGGQLTLS